MSWADRARLLAPALLALIGFAAAGRLADGLVVGLGASIALFGAGLPAARRAATLVTAGLLLLLAIATGYQVADVFLTLILWNLIVAVLATVVDAALPLGAPGPWSLVLMVDVGSLLGMDHLGLRTTLLHVGLGCLIGVLTGLVDSLYVGRRATGAFPPTSRPVGLRPRAWVASWRFVEVYIAVLLASTFTHATADRHPFWPVLLVVLVLSGGGGRARLVQRAVRCLVGALVGVVVFAPLSRLTLPTGVLVALVCVLGLLALRFVADREVPGAFLVTLLALTVTLPLLPTASPMTLGLEHAADALVAVGLSLVMIVLVRPLSRITMKHLK